MSRKLQALVEHREDVVYVKLEGAIDEDNDLGELTQRIPPGAAVIDLAGIERINSCGVRDWVNWLTALEGHHTRVVIVACSPPIVAQINLVNNFTGAGVVTSFHAPYYCARCEREQLLLLEVTDLESPLDDPPTCRCDACDGVMDFDDLESSYFAFVSDHRKAALRDEVRRVLPRRDRPTSTPRLRSAPRLRATQATFTSSPSWSRIQLLPSLAMIDRPPMSPPADRTVVALLVATLFVAIGVLALYLLATPS